MRVCAMNIALGIICSFSFSNFIFKMYTLQSKGRNDCRHPSQFVRYQNLSRETNAKRLVLVSVMTHYETVNTRAVAVNKTWGQDIPGKVIFFVGNMDNKTKVDLPLVILPVADDVYPPQKKAMLMLKYVYEHYRDSFRWFIRADDDVYFNSVNLQALLISISGSNDVLLGHPGIGTTEEKGKLGLEEESNFCIGGTGIVMSSSVLKKIYRHLDYCIKNTATAHEDSEVGRCIKKFVGVQCPWGYEASEMFHQDYGDDQRAYHGDLDLIPFDKIVSLHPVKNAQYVFRLHHHVLSIKLRERQNHLRRLQKHLKNIEKILTASESDLSFSYCKLEQCGEIHSIDNVTHGENLPPKIWAMFRDFQSYGVQQFSNPVESIRGSKAKTLKLVTERAKRGIIQEEKPQLYHGYYFGNFTVGYTRESPTRGNLYGVHYMVRMKRDVGYGKTKTFLEPRQVKFKNTFGSLIARIQQEKPQEELVNIILPCKGPANLFEDFLKNLYQMVEKFRETLSVFVVFSRAEIAYSEGKTFKSIFEKYQKQIRTTKFVWVEVNPKSSLRKVLKHFTTNQLLLLTRTDFVINADFLKRCRHNSEKQKPYFPLALKTRDRKDGYQSGRWESENYSTVCVYSDDVKILDNVHSTENATSSLADMFIAREEHVFNIFRAPDPGLLLVDRSRPSCLTKDEKSCDERFPSTKSLFDYMFEKKYLKEFL